MTHRRRVDGDDRNPVQAALRDVRHQAAKGRAERGFVERLVVDDADRHPLIGHRRAKGGEAVAQRVHEETAPGGGQHEGVTFPPAGRQAGGERVPAEAKALDRTLHALDRQRPHAWPTIQHPVDGRQADARLGGDLEHGDLAQPASLRHARTPGKTLWPSLEARQSSRLVPIPRVSIPRRRKRFAAVQCDAFASCVA